MDKYINPIRVVKATDAFCYENILGGKSAQIPFIREGLEYGIAKDCTRINDGGYILLDYGKELHGCIRVFVQSVTDINTKLKITFGESAMEAFTENGVKNSGNHHSIREYEVPAVRLSMQKVGEIGFRFVKIQAVGGDVSLYCATAVPEIRDLEYKGSFRCNDERLNEIWQTGAYTVQLNVHDYIWDGVKRDRLVWIGDMHPEVSTVRCVFGKDESVPRSLDFERDAAPPDVWMNKIATYSMWWIIIQHDWYMHWGDIQYLSEQREYLEKLTEKIFGWLDSGAAVGEGMEGFVDWGSLEEADKEEGRKAITAIALNCAAEMFEAFGDNTRSEKCRTYRDALLKEETYETNKRISGLTVLSGRNSKFARKVIGGNSPKEMSTFIGYYVLKAKAMLGEHKEALDIIRNYWGAMLDKGATTFWEEFNIEWAEDSGRIDELTPDGLKDIHSDFGKNCYRGFRHSLCHGWASGPTPFLMEQIGGIEILEPGCRKVRISPNLCDLDWIEVEYPTPFGNIRIKAKQENGKTVTDISAPEEIEIIR